MGACRLTRTISPIAFYLLWLTSTSPVRATTGSARWTSRGTITTITGIARLQACQVLLRRIPPADTSKYQYQCRAQNGEDVPNCRVILWPK